MSSTSCASVVVLPLRTFSPLSERDIVSPVFGDHLIELALLFRLEVDEEGVIAGRRVFVCDSLFWTDRNLEDRAVAAVIILDRLLIGADYTGILPARGVNQVFAVNQRIPACDRRGMVKSNSSPRGWKPVIEHEILRYETIIPS